MAKSASQPFRIVYVDNPSVKASRYRLSGALRYAAAHADLTVISVNFDHGRINSRTVLDAMRKITDNHPDALIGLWSFFEALRKQSMSLPDIPTARPVSLGITTKGPAHPADVLGILDDEELCRAAVDLRSLPRLRLHQSGHLPQRLQGFDRRHAKQLAKVLNPIGTDPGRISRGRLSRGSPCRPTRSPSPTRRARSASSRAACPSCRRRGSPRRRGPRAGPSPGSCA